MNKHIRRQIKRAVSWSKDETAPSNPQAHILSGLDVLRVLEDNAPKYLQDVLFYEPRSVVGQGWATYRFSVTYPHQLSPTI
ncbi:MAG: hypothetical protein Q9P44_12360 [Anaerolineae bacterium]|nr:hypothetical protein [Anaerolineae bacterium]